MDRKYRVAAYVDLEAIRENLRRLKKDLPGETQLLAVVKTDAYGVVAASFMTLNPDALGGDSNAELLSMDMSKIGPAGFGFSFDLGAEYKVSVGSVVDGLTVSLSALDLGAYFFNESSLQGFESKGEATYEGMKDIDYLVFAAALYASAFGFMLVWLDKRGVKIFERL